MEKNIKIEMLSKSFKLPKMLIGLSVTVIIGTLIVGKVTHAGFTSTINVPLVKGKVTYVYPDIKIESINVKDSSGNYIETDRMPGSDYVINESKTYCTKNFTTEKDQNIKIFTNEDGQHILEKVTKNDKCHLYFDKDSFINVNDILAKYTKNNSRNGEITAGFKSSTPTTVYSKEDDDGTSYVFAGVNPNNWVKLGNLYFRIIRFNGNGSMRLIYSGAISPQTEEEKVRISAKAFNETSNDNMYVGLKYEGGNVHGTIVNSTILGDKNSDDATTLYGWYNNKLTNYENLFDVDAGFCSDRSPSTSSTELNGAGGIGNGSTYYGGFIRFYNGGNIGTINTTPTLKCNNQNDKFKIPIGLITGDEYMLAGGGSYKNIDTYNTEFWLHTGESYWTMTPARFFGSIASVFVVNMEGHLGMGNSTHWTGPGVRPVINIKSTAEFRTANKPDGSIDHPYVIKI